MANKKHITQTSYITGFFLSIILTLIAYFLVVKHIFDTTAAMIVLFSLAFAQLIVQLIFFLHLTHEQKPRWNLIFFIATAGIIFIVVVGSVWIINHLNYNMTPAEMEQFLRTHQGGF